MKHNDEIIGHLDLQRVEAGEDGFRIWTAQPTDEERKEAKWDEFPRMD